MLQLVVFLERTFHIQPHFPFIVAFQRGVIDFVLRKDPFLLEVGLVFVIGSAVEWLVESGC